jgi:hypothetical protein
LQISECRSLGQSYSSFNAAAPLESEIYNLKSAIAVTPAFLLPHLFAID